MLRFDEIDLLSELNKLTTIKIGNFPRERDYLNDLKNGLFEEQNALKEILLKIYKEVKHANQSTPLSLQTCENYYTLANTIYLFLENKTNKDKDTRTTLEYPLYAAIRIILDEFKRVIQSHYFAKEIPVINQLGLIKITFLINELLHKYFCVYDEKKFTGTSSIGVIQDLLYEYIKVKIGNNQLEELKEILKVNKKVILANQAQLQRFNVYLPIMTRDYINSAKVAVNLGEFDKAKKYTKKFLSLCEDPNNEDSRLNEDIPVVLKSFVLRLYKESNYFEALKWAKLNVEFLEPLAQMIFNKDAPLIVKDIVARTAKDIKFFGFLIPEIQNKQQVFFKSELAAFLKKINDKFIITYLSENKFSVSLADNNTHLAKLAFKLNKMNIVCFYDNQQQKIVFNDLLNIEISTLRKTVTSWNDRIKTKERLNKISETLNNAETINVSPTQGISSHSTKNIVVEMKEKSKQKKIKPEVAETPRVVNEEVTNIINWGNNYPSYNKAETTNVYPLYGQTAHNQYLYINQGFFSKLNQENPDAAQTLVAICDRGKVINDSRGNKGIIIESNEVKIKDSSKSYRFYGKTVATTKHKDKTCSLIEVNSWHPDPH